MPSFTFVSTANAFVLRGADAGLRRHPRRHAQPRRAAGRGGDHGPHARDRRRALRGRRVRDGRAHRDRRATSRARARSRTPRRRSARRIVADRSAAFGVAGRAQLPRDEERHLRRGRRAARQRPALRRTRRDHPRQGYQPPGVLPRRGRQVHVGGRRLVVRRRARSSQRFCGRSSRRRPRSRPTRLAIWHALPRRVRGAGGATAGCGDRSCPTRARTTRTCTTCSRATPTSATHLIEQLNEHDVNAVFHYVPLHSVPGRSALRARRR